ncbi:hypothetical protein [Arthrobacter sp. CAN_C5]|nr:hypothetical protein [Arthrobacter sp. CAN_C5]MBP2218030.1 hypothetical protein [Arthrobacter sp. CAN_C5]
MSHWPQLTLTRRAAALPDEVSGRIRHLPDRWEPSLAGYDGLLAAAGSR